MKSKLNLKTATALTFAGATFAWAGVAAAATALSLVGPIQGNTVGPQSSSNPCVIAGTTCQQPNAFGYNNFVSNGSTADFNMYSTTPTGTVADGVQGSPYTVGQLAGAGLVSFNVAIDVNTTSAAGETLQLFEVLGRTASNLPYTVLYNYIGPTNIANIANNGNGYADWTLNTVNLAALPSTEQILFHAVWTNASDGAESFFLISTVPEPETYGLLLSGLGLMGFMARRRRQGK